jgi:hypothetical protein
MNIITEAAQNPGSGMTSAADIRYTDHTTRKFGLMLYANEKDISGVKKTGTWPQITQLLSKRDSRSNKSGKAFSPGVLKPGSARASEQVQSGKETCHARDSLPADGSLSRRLLQLVRCQRHSVCRRCLRGGLCCLVFRYPKSLA